MFADYNKRPALNGDTKNDANVYALEWAEKKYNAKVVYKIYSYDKMKESFSAAAMAGQFFADIVTAN